MRPKFLGATLLLSAMMLSTGCMKTTIAVQPGAVDDKSADHTMKATFLLWGLVGNEQVNVKALCPGGAQWMQTSMSFVDGLLGSLTGGIYAPRTVKVKCAGGSAYMFDETETDGFTVVHELDDTDAALEVVR